MAHFADIIDQNQIVNHMQNAIKTEKLSHAYIISGPEGSGKKMLANTFAQTIMCEDRKDVGNMLESCRECHSCKQAESGTHPDIRIITHEKPKTIGIDDIREQVCDDVYIKPYSDHKIYIIPDGEMMTVQAQNAILKTLEEPPAYAVIIILTSNIDAFLPTILSRCIIFPVKPVRDDLILKYLMEKKKIVDYKARLCVSFAQGNVGKAVLLSENEGFERLKNSVIDLIGRLERLKIYETADRIQQMLVRQKDDDKPTKKAENPEEDEDKKEKSTGKKLDPILIMNFFDILSFFMRDVLVYKAENSPTHLIFADKLSYISSVTEKCSYEELEEILKAIEVARARINSNVNALLTLEMLMINIKENL